MYRLTLEREKRGLSKTQLAIKVGIHPATLGRIEAGKVFPYPGWRRKLSETLGVPEDELFEVVDNRGLGRPSGGADH